jgi:hypothetical protein
VKILRRRLRGARNEIGVALLMIDSLQMEVAEASRVPESGYVSASVESAVNNTTQVPEEQAHSRGQGGNSKQLPHK